LQKVKRSDEHKFPATERLLVSARGAGSAAIVQSLSDDADVLSDRWREKGLQMQIFCEAADGIRTHDLLHGKQSVVLSLAREMPANEQLPTG
jgi:hypothetical protein